MVGLQPGDAHVQGAQLAGPALDEAGGHGRVQVVPAVGRFAALEVGQPADGLEAGVGRGEGHGLGPVGVRMQESRQGTPGVVDLTVCGELRIVALEALGAGREFGAGEHGCALVQAGGGGGVRAARSAGGDQQDEQHHRQQAGQDRAEQARPGHRRPGRRRSSR